MSWIQAFILTKGTKHYRTINRGSTWQSFETDLPPAGGVSALSFHATELNWVLYSGQQCETSSGPFAGKTCFDDAFVSTDAFATKPTKLMDHTSKCVWAHANREFSTNAAKEAIFCIAFESQGAQTLPTNGNLADWIAGIRSLRESRLYTSSDFFKSKPELVDLGIGKEARGVVGIGAVSGFLVGRIEAHFGTNSHLERRTKWFYTSRRTPRNGKEASFRMDMA